MRLTFLCLLALAAGATLLGPAASPRLLDETRAAYLEDEGTGRRLASLHLRLEAQGPTTRLRIGVSALGATVDPVPGFRGVHGGNHITARELTRLCQTGQLRLCVLSRGGAGKRFGSLQPIAHGRIPERRLRADGSLDLAAESPETFILAIEAVSPPLPPGEHEVYLEAKGIPRLRADVRVGPHTAAILGVHSLAGHDLEVER